MDYKFTFEDGSEALAHYGVKGMKWGVRKARQTLEGGGGGGGVPEEELDFNAEDFGFEDNSKESQDAALAEAGLSRDMTREQALAKIEADFDRLDKEHPLKDANAKKRRDEAKASSMKLANALPRASKEYKEEKAYNSKKNKYPATAATDDNLNKRLIQDEAKRTVKNRKSTDSIAKTVSEVKENALSVRNTYSAYSAAKDAVNKILNNSSKGTRVDNEYESEKSYNSKKNR